MPRNEPVSARREPRLLGALTTRLRSRLPDGVVHTRLPNAPRLIRKYVNRRPTTLAISPPQKLPTIAPPFRVIIVNALSSL